MNRNDQVQITQRDTAMISIDHFRCSIRERCESQISKIITVSSNDRLV
jgi:hypothetical protein